MTNLKVYNYSWLSGNDPQTIIKYMIRGEWFHYLIIFKPQIKYEDAISSVSAVHMSTSKCHYAETKEAVHLIKVT